MIRKYFYKKYFLTSSSVKRTTSSFLFIKLFLSKNSLLTINIKEIWHYRDLLLMLVKRDYVTFYKQVCKALGRLTVGEHELAEACKWAFERERHDPENY